MLKDDTLFEQIANLALEWIQPWFTHGERRYRNQWKIASFSYCMGKMPPAYLYKVGREVLKVAIKLKKSQGRPRVKWPKPEHHLIAISHIDDVHTNYVEALNSTLRQTPYNVLSKTPESLCQVNWIERALNMQRFLHNWVRPHLRLGNKTTPTMAAGLVDHPLSIAEMLTRRELQAPIPYQDSAKNRNL